MDDPHDEMGQPRYPDKNEKQSDAASRALIAWVVLFLIVIVVGAAIAALT